MGSQNFEILFYELSVFVYIRFKRWNLRRAFMKSFICDFMEIQVFDSAGFDVSTRSGEPLWLVGGGQGGGAARVADFPNLQKELNQVKTEHKSMSQWP